MRWIGVTIKTIYLIRHAKSDWSDTKASDFERGLKKRGVKDLDVMSSFISIKDIRPDLILSSSALRAQVTADRLAKSVGYDGRIHYMEELYMARPKTLINILSLQENQYDSIFLIGHNPELTELANLIVKESFVKLPTLGILAINIDIDSWENIEDGEGEIDFFIYPKQFKYYLSRANMPRDKK